MFNFHNKKTKRVFSSVIIIFLVLAMIIPTLAYLVGQFKGCETSEEKYEEIINRLRFVSAWHYDALWE